MTSDLPGVGSMQPEFAIDGADFGGLDQPCMCDRHRVQRPFQRLEPEAEEAIEGGKSRAQVVVLPDVGLQQPGMIGAPVEDLRGGEPIPLNLLAEVCRDHVCPPSLRRNKSDGT